MDHSSEGLPDDRIRPEIMKLMAETVRLSADQAMINAELRKKGRERWWVPVLAIGAGVCTGAVVVLTKLFA